LVWQAGVSADALLIHNFILEIYFHETLYYY
jgi:hypothetical protein